MKRLTLIAVGMSVFLISCGNYFLLPDDEIIVYEYPSEDYALVFSKNLVFHKTPRDITTKSGSEPDLYYIFVGDSLSKIKSLPVEENYITEKILDEETYLVYRYYPPVESNTFGVSYIDLYVKEDQIKFIKVAAPYVM